MIEMIVKYGTPLVITAIVLYGAFNLMNIGIAKLESTCLPAEREAANHDRLLEVRKNIDRSINIALERVLMRTNADRAFVFEFHNGGANLGGLPFIKMSNTYEVVDTGIAPQRQNLGQVSLSMLSGFVSEISTKPYLTINVSDRDEKIPNIYYETLLAQGTHSCILVRISDIRGKIIGYCGVDFVREGKSGRRQADICLIKEIGRASCRERV